jgi:hypothetical protein
MSDAISRVKAHFDSLTPRTITVPEWGDLEIHATPVTLSERSRIYAGAEKLDEHEVVCRILIHKAKDRDGKPLFTQADMPALLHHSDPTVVVRVASQIMAQGAPEASELGNS